MKTYLYTKDPYKEKRVRCGQYDSDTNIFTRYVFDNHYMLKYSGYGIQSDIVMRLKRKGCTTVRLLEDTTGCILTSLLSDWIENFEAIADMGGGVQYFYKREKMGGTLGKPYISRRQNNV